MLALWNCGRRAGVVQAQRQIHRALRTAFTIAETVIRTIADQPALAVPGATPASAVMVPNTIRCAASRRHSFSRRCNVPQLPVRVGTGALSMQSLQQLARCVPRL